MSQKTRIEWAEHSWNPIRGCSRVSPGCLNCHAERMAARFSGGPDVVAYGDFGGELREEYVPAQPFHGFATEKGWTGHVALIEEKLLEPLHRRKPTVYFVNSMSDLFHEALPDDAIDRVFAVMALCPQHRFLVLTKREERMEEYSRHVQEDPERIWCAADQLDIPYRLVPEHVQEAPYPLMNVGLGVSVENQEYADLRIPHLLRTPAAMRFVSLEPLLGAPDVTKCHQEAGREGRNERPAMAAGRWPTQRIKPARPGRRGRAPVSREELEKVRERCQEWARMCGAEDSPFPHITKDALRIIAALEDARQALAEIAALPEKYETDPLGGTMGAEAVRIAKKAGGQS